MLTECGAPTRNVRMVMISNSLSSGPQVLCTEQRIFPQRFRWGDVSVIKMPHPQRISTTRFCVSGLLSRRSSTILEHSSYVRFSVCRRATNIIEWHREAMDPEKKKEPCVHEPKWPVHERSPIWELSCGCFLAPLGWSKSSIHNKGTNWSTKATGPRANEGERRRVEATRNK